MNESTLSYTNEKVPRSNEYKDKAVVKEGYATVKGTRYYMRVFFDESVELARFDYGLNKWIFLLFN